MPSRKKKTNYERHMEFYEKVAQEFIDALERGTAPWQKDWTDAPLSLRFPRNGASGRLYHGGNALYLMVTAQKKGYSDPRWLTFKQIKDKGGSVRKGEHGTTVEYWKWPAKVDADGNEIPKEKLPPPVVFRAVVFNVSQTEGLKLPPLDKDMPERQWENVERAERIIKASGVPLIEDQLDNCYYSPSQDVIHVVRREYFRSSEGFYSTVLHELCHSTAHPDRLDRSLSFGFGSQGYAREELRAEIGSYMLCSNIGIAPRGVDGNHAAYVKAWIDVLKKDPAELFRAARDADKICSYLYAQEAKYMANEAERENAVPGPEENKAEISRAILAKAVPETQERTLYKYYLNARPADIGAVPEEGMERIDEADKGGRYGAIYYTRPLSDKEIKDYELVAAAAPREYMRFIPAALAASTAQGGEIPAPDGSITPGEMQEYGYKESGMLPLKEARAEALFGARFDIPLTLYRLYPDGSERVVEDGDELKLHAAAGGIFGIEKAAWEAWHAKRTQELTEPLVTVVDTNIRQIGGSMYRGLELPLSEMNSRLPELAKEYRKLPPRLTGGETLPEALIRVSYMEGGREKFYFHTYNFASRTGEPNFRPLLLDMQVNHDFDAQPDSKFMNYLSAHVETAELKKDFASELEELLELEKKHPKLSGNLKFLNTRRFIEDSGRELTKAQGFLNGVSASAGEVPDYNGLQALLLMCSFRHDRLLTHLSREAQEGRLSGVIAAKGREKGQETPVYRRVSAYGERIPTADELREHRRELIATRTLPLVNKLDAYDGYIALAKSYVKAGLPIDDQEIAYVMLEEHFTQADIRMALTLESPEGYAMESTKKAYERAGAVLEGARKEYLKNKHLDLDGTAQAAAGRRLKSLAAMGVTEFTELPAGWQQAEYLKHAWIVPPGYAFLDNGREQGSEGYKLGVVPLVVLISHRASELRLEAIAKTADFTHKGAEADIAYKQAAHDAYWSGRPVDDRKIVRELLAAGYSRYQVIMAVYRSSPQFPTTDVRNYYDEVVKFVDGVQDELSREKESNSLSFKLPATDEQKKLLGSLGIRFEKSLTIGEAAEKLAKARNEVIEKARAAAASGAGKLKAEASAEFAGLSENIPVPSAAGGKAAAAAEAKAADAKEPVADVKTAAAADAKAAEVKPAAEAGVQAAEAEIAAKEMTGKKEAEKIAETAAAQQAAQVTDTPQAAGGDVKGKTEVLSMENRNMEPKAAIVIGSGGIEGMEVHEGGGKFAESVKEAFTGPGEICFGEPQPMATEKQMELLKKNGLEVSEVLSAQEASELISTLPPTERQIETLKAAGYEVNGDLTYGSAGEVIKTLPATDKQKELMTKLRIDYAENVTMGEASKALDLKMKEREERAKEPATAKQTAYLDREKIRHSENLTRGEASRLIGAHLREKGEHEPVTEKQAAFLAKEQLTGEKPANRGEASRIITEHLREKDNVPMTAKQLEYIKQHKLEVPANATRGAAAKLIGQEIRRQDILNYHAPAGVKGRLSPSEAYKGIAQKMLKDSGAVNALSDTVIAGEMLKAGYGKSQVVNAVHSCSPYCVKSGRRAFAAVNSALKNPAVKKSLEAACAR